METESENKLNLYEKLVYLIWRIFVFIFNIILGIFFLSFLASIFFHFAFINIERGDVFQTPFKETITNISAFPKESISLSNTFIFQDDINKMVKRYKAASPFERVSIRQEPLTRKLMEKGVFREKSTRFEFLIH